MRKCFSLFFLVFVCSPLAVAAAEPEIGKKSVVGWVEKTKVLPGEVLLDAKLDPGVTTTSVHADNITPFTKDGERWVRFSMSGRNGRQEHFERKVIRSVRIKSSSGKKKSRYTVSLEYCIGSLRVADQVSLANRSHLEQEMRVGRHAIAGYYLIDPAKVFQTLPSCSIDKGKT